MSNKSDTSTVPGVVHAETQNQFWVAQARFPETPMIIDDFRIDQDVIVISDLGLTRSDLRFTQEGSATLISATGRANETFPLALLKGVSVIDLNPAVVVQRMYDALNQGDVPGVLDLLADDVLWEVPGPRDILPWAGAWHGYIGVTEFLNLFRGTVQTRQFSLQRLMTQGNTVVAVIEEDCIASTTNLPYRTSVVQLVTVQHGKITALQSYMDTFPIVEAMKGGRPFTIQPTTGNPHYVVAPVAAKRPTDTFVFDPAELAGTATSLSVVKQMYAALQAADWVRMREVLASAISWHMFGPEDLLSWAGQRQGRDLAIESCQLILATIRIDYSRPIRIITQGDTVVVVIDEAGASRATGLPFQTSVVHLITVDGTGEAAVVKQVLNYINTSWLVEAFLGGRPFTVK